jgi:hypothetical protein
MSSPWSPGWKQEGDYEYDSEKFASLKDAMAYSGYTEEEDMEDEDEIIEE